MCCDAFILTATLTNLNSVHITGVFGVFGGKVVETATAQP